MQRLRVMNCAGASRLEDSWMLAGARREAVYLLACRLVVGMLRNIYTICADLRPSYGVQKSSQRISHIVYGTSMSEILVTGSPP